jgi:N-acetylglucosaminyldiphosphoundecaprenol N-acetyl-beta-D-mannosaminyltransferase
VGSNLDRTVLLFYREPAKDRLVPFDRYARKLVRPLYKRLKGGQAVTGFFVWYTGLIRALRQAGYRVLLNDRRTAKKNPGHPVGLVGYPEVLDGWDLPNPAVLGPGLFDHPRIRPDLMKDPRFRYYLVTCDWMRALFEPVYGERCVSWHGGIDTGEWPDTRRWLKSWDVLVYDKIRWEREKLEPGLLAPVLAKLEQRGLSYRVIRYGAYQHAGYRDLLGRSKSLLFLCEHETQGMAYQEALASNVPVLAWDNGYWRDPKRSLWEDRPVPASSVPYFSAECGERFRDLEGFDAAADAFFEDLSRYQPRRYVERELSLSSSAAKYLACWESLREESPSRLHRTARAIEPRGQALARPRLRLGDLEIDRLTFAEAIDDIDSLVSAGRGGSVFTPNVDHVVNVGKNPLFRQAYSRASLSLVDGTPLLWASRLLGAPLPEKISGSDLVLPLADRAAKRGWRLYLTGAGPGIADRAAEVLKRQFGVTVVGTDAPLIKLSSKGVEAGAEDLARIQAARPNLVLVAYGSPKQELWIDRHAASLAPAVFVAIGAGLDFVAGHVRRAPRWISRCGLEWLWRLAQEPRRLWKRYLVNDPAFLFILAKSFMRGRRGAP